MFGIINYEAFIIAVIILSVTPGADTMYILSRSISQGKKAGVLSVLGIVTGTVFHILFATFGLSIVLAKSAVAFETVKYLGAAYLVFLGIKSMVTKQSQGVELDNKKQKASNTKIYLSGILTNILNPKVALFFLAFLPQFINPFYENPSISFLALGFTFMSIGTTWCFIVVLFSAKLSESIRKNKKVKMWLDKITGGVFIALGIKLALSKK